MRNRLWRVNRVAGNVLQAVPLDGQGEEHQFYLPFESLTTAEVEWPQAKDIGSRANQDLLLRAYRLGLVHGAAPLLSLQRSSVIPTAYQLVPVAMALGLPRVRMLLADDVGLGKTIEAGLVVTELIARNRVRRLLIVTPANLREQWQEAMQRFFHMEIPILSSTHRRALERQIPLGANPWSAYPSLLASIDYVKTEAIRHQVLEQRWDLVIIDEAHNVARPHQGTPDSRVDMERWDFARRIADCTEHLLLLTATPHNGYADTFASLLQLLDPKLAQGEGPDPHVHRAQARLHVVQRRRQDVEFWFQEGGQHNPFPQRETEEVVVPPSEAERAAIAALEAYGNRVLDAAERSGKGRMISRWTVMHLHKRALSSPEAFRRSLRNRKESLLAALRSETDGEGIEERTARDFTLEQVLGERYNEEEASAHLDRAVQGERENLEAQLGEVERLIELAERITPSRDSKLSRLLTNTLRVLLTKEKGRVVLFTRYRDTLNYLEKAIREASYFQSVGCAVWTLHGEMSDGARKEVIQRFAEGGKAVLIATDAISEGINLQQAANQIIHYELPWNPNRLEQRNGRVDRFGQPERIVRVRTMVMDDTLDATILEVLVKKTEQIRRDFGFAPPFFGDDATILDLIREHGRHASLGASSHEKLYLFDGPQAEARKGESIRDPFDPAVLKTIQEQSFYGQTPVGFEEVVERQERAQNLAGSVQEVERFVISAVRWLGGSVRSAEGLLDHGLWRIQIPHGVVQVPGVPEESFPAIFDAQLSVAHPDAEILDLGHPLVQALIERVRHETFRPGQHFGRITAFAVAEVQTVTALLHGLCRFTAGTMPPTLMEEVISVGLPVYEDHEIPPSTVKDLFNAQSLGDRAPAAVREAVEDLFGRQDLRSRLATEVQRRAEELAEEGRRLQASQAGAENWSDGLDRVEVASWDLLAVTIYFPAMGGRP